MRARRFPLSSGIASRMSSYSASKFREGSNHQGVLPDIIRVDCGSTRSGTPRREGEDKATEWEFGAEVESKAGAEAGVTGASRGEEGKEEKWCQV